MRKLRVLDLFSGIGGFSLGLERTGGFETAAFCEIEPFPRRVLAKHWPGIKIHDDVRALKGPDIDGPIDVICGGYPCQPFSTAGKRAGKDDDRHLWPEFSRLVDELRPTWIIGENVSGHISMGLDDVLSDLEGKGYACRPFVIPACAKGAPHRRDRVWVVANRDDKPRATVRGECSHVAGEGIGRGIVGGGCISDAEWEKPVRSAGEYSRDVAHAISERGNVGTPEHGAHGRQVAARNGDVPDANSHNAQGQQPGGVDAEERARPDERQARSQDAGDGGQRGAEPGMGGGDDGVSAWLDGTWERGIPRVVGHIKRDNSPAEGGPFRHARLKALGNAVVPQIPYEIGRAILAAEAERSDQ